MSDLPTCRLCGHQAHWLGRHLIEAHGISEEDYLEEFPTAETVSAEIKGALGDAPERKHPETTIKIDFGGVPFLVNVDVPENACLKMPEAYRVPIHGILREDIQCAAISLAAGRSLYIWGLPGSGKDAFFHAWSALTRTPAVMFTIEPHADIRAWFFSRSFDKDGTSWEEGEMLKALRDGYMTTAGRRVPYLIVISDFDRATKEQAESLRLVLDSIEGRVKGPAGTTYKVLPGTRVVVTANTAGSGDVRGRMVSANVIDASITDRFDRVYEFHWLDWQDEEIIVRAKFPLLIEKCEKVFGSVGGATKALRAAIATDTLYAEFSHRAVCVWLGNAEDIVRAEKKVPTDLLARAFRAYADRLPDEATRLNARRLVDASIQGGALDINGAPAGGVGRKRRSR